MKEMIRKFTCGHPQHMNRPVLWLFLENFTMGFPAIAVYLAIQVLGQAFADPAGTDLTRLWQIAAVLGGLLLVQLLASLGAFLNTFLPATVHSAENKTAFVKKLRSLPLGYFMRKESGELINTFTNDFLAVEQSMVGMFTGIFSVVIACVLTSVILFWFNPVMAAAFYAGIIIAVILIGCSAGITNRLTKNNIAARDRTATYLNEYLLGMKTLKSYNQTGEEFDKLKDAYHNLMKVNVHAEVVGGSLMSLANTFASLGLPLMCFAGSYLILGGRLSVVDYLGLIVIGTKISAPVLTWVRYMVMIRTHYVSASRIDDVLCTPAMAGGERANGHADIRFEHVSFSYLGDENVLSDLNVTIPAGKLTAVVGPSGGGKSTILRLLARFWDVDKGAVLCGTKRLRDCEPEVWMENVSMVLQEVYLFHDTVRENILFGRRDASEEEMIEAAKRARCHEFIMALPDGYDTVVGEGGNTLSGGEKQRISIARAILKDAPILLLDEPTSSLDAKNEVAIQKAIGELVKGRTVVMIAHRLKTVQHAHQILVLDEGRIKEQGSHEQLMSTGGTYRQLWDLQHAARDFKVSG